VDEVLRVPHVTVLTIQRANAAPSFAGGDENAVAVVARRRAM